MGDTHMIVSRYKPFGNVWVEMQRLHDEMNRALNRAGLTRGQAERSDATFPTLNVWEDGDNLQAEAELPGMELNDLEIYVTAGNQFTIQGERKAPQTENAQWHRRERGIGKFSRTLTLPVAVDAEKVTATLTHGVLKVRLPKSAEAKPRRIPINAN
jgi:HSP20 family protein